MLKDFIFFDTKIIKVSLDCKTIVLIFIIKSLNTNFMIKNLLLIFVFSILLFSCSKSQESRDYSSRHLNTILFEKLDSIQIEYLGNPTVHDIDPKNRKVLFMDHQSAKNMIYYADFDGTILASYSKVGNIPDSYGLLNNTLFINDSTSFFVNSFTGLFKYSFNGELISKKMFSDINFFNSFKLGMGYGMEKVNSKLVKPNLGYDIEKTKDFKSIGEVKTMTLTDVNSGEVESIISIPEQSIFRSDKYFFNKAWEPAFTIKSDQLHIVFGIEPKIYVFELQPPYSFVNSIPFDLPSYNYFQGANEFINDVQFHSQAKVSGQISTIKWYQDYFLISYFPGYDKVDAEEYFKDKTEEESKLFTDRMLEKYQHRVAILNSKGELVSYFVPDELFAGTMLIRDGELWMSEKPNKEVEKDYFKLYKIGLKENP